MEPLGRDARGLLRLARGSHEPPTTAKTRLRAQLDAKLAATALVGTTGLLGKTTLAHAAFPAIKSVFVSLVLVGAVSAGYVVAPVLRPRAAARAIPARANAEPSTPGHLKRVRTEELVAPPPPRASSAEGAVDMAEILPRQTGTHVAARHLSRDASDAPQPLAEPGVVAEPATEPQEEGSVQPTTDRQARHQLAEETRLIRLAHQAILQRQPVTALAYLEEHQRDYPFGALQKERDAARIVATCRLSRMQEAEVLWARFISTWPSSPLEARIRSSCHWENEH